MTNKETKAVFDRLARRYLQEMIGAERPAGLNEIDAATLVWRICYDPGRKAQKVRMIWRIAFQSAEQALADSGLQRRNCWYILPPLAATVAEGQDPARSLLTA